MSLHDYAENELKKMGLLDGEGDFYCGFTGKCVLELIDTFVNQDHSGSSAPYVSSIFKRLANYKPLSPLTGEDDEWIELPDGRYQNKRWFAIFKNCKDGTAYNVEGQIFSDNGGQTWYTNRDSWVYIDFPYVVPDSPEKVFVDKESDNDD